MKEYRSNITNRMFLLLGMLLLLPMAIVFQLIRINVVQGDELRSLWSAQAVDYIPIPAQRGSIFDTSGNIMVTNTVAYTVAVDPLYRGMTKQKLDTVCTILSAVTNRPVSYYKRKLTSAPRGSRYVVMGKKMPINVYEELYPLNFKGLILEEHYQRRYNYDSLASHVVGFVNHTSQGMIGLEKFYDEELKGQDGVQQVQRDRSGNIRAIVGAPQKKPEHGYHLTTTLDIRIQAIVEEEIRKAALEFGAEKGLAIVMNPRTGAIKAMANFPSFNPNVPGYSKSENRRNFAISDIIEPGSTFKLVTAISAIEQKVTQPNEIFSTPESGQLLLYGQWMRDHNPLGALTFSEVFSKSSNIATSEIAMRMKPATFYQYVRNIGFGTPTSIDLPSESDGKLRRPHQWSQVTLPWMSVGYEILTTPIQILQAYAAFANDGMLMQPYVVEEIRHQDGTLVKKRSPVEVRRIAEPSTIDQLRPILEAVVSDSGTAAKAQIQGLRIAGKTGTAQKYIAGKYQTIYRASFVGYFPADDPQYVCLVLMDEPNNSYYGGTVAAPIFKKIALRIVGMDAKLQEKMTVKERHIADQFPDLKGYSQEEARKFSELMKWEYDFVGKGSIVVSQKLDTTALAVGSSKMIFTLADSQLDAEGLITVPDVRSMSMREAVHILRTQSLEVTKIGSGTIFAQYPKAGSSVREGTSITLRGKALSLESLAIRRPE